MNFYEPSPPRGAQQQPTPRGRRPPLYTRGGGGCLVYGSRPKLPARPARAARPARPSGRREGGGGLSVRVVKPAGPRCCRSKQARTLVQALEQPEQGCQLSMVSDITCCGLVSRFFLLERAMDSITDTVVDEVKMSPVKYTHSKL
jgi:hypothetical protein